MQVGANSGPVVLPHVNCYVLYNKFTALEGVSSSAVGFVCLLLTGAGYHNDSNGKELKVVCMAACKEVAADPSIHKITYLHLSFCTLNLRQISITDTDSSACHSSGNESDEGWKRMQRSDSSSHIHT